MSEDLIKRIVSGTVAELKKIESKSFYINEEVHYNQHKFLEGLMKWSEGTTSTIGKTIATIAVTGVVSLIVWGFIAWGSKSLKG